MEKLPSFHQMGGAWASTIYVYSDHQPNRQNIEATCTNYQINSRKKKKDATAVVHKPTKSARNLLGIVFCASRSSGSFWGFWDAI